MEILIFLAIALAVIVYIYEDDAPVKEKPSHKINHKPYREAHIIPDAVLQLTIDEHIKQLPKQVNKEPLFFDISDELLETYKQSELERMYRHHRVKSSTQPYSIMFNPF